MYREILLCSICNNAEENCGRNEPPNGHHALYPVG